MSLFFVRGIFDRKLQVSELIDIEAIVRVLPREFGIPSK